MAITYTCIHYNGYLWSSPLSQHHRVWTSHFGLHEQCMAKVYIFPRSSSTLGEGNEMNRALGHLCAHIG